MNKNDNNGFDENVIQIKRVSKKNSGGNRISFSALVVVGDKDGTVGYALGKAPSVSEAIQKGIRKARKESIKVNLVDGTIPYDTSIKMGSAKIYAKPAPSGAGIIAGGAVRSVLEVAGVKNISAKVLGTRNKNLNVRATFQLLKNLKKQKVKAKKLVTKNVK